MANPLDETEVRLRLLRLSGSVASLMISSVMSESIAPLNEPSHFLLNGKSRSIKRILESVKISSKNIFLISSETSVVLTSVFVMSF